MNYDLKPESRQLTILFIIYAIAHLWILFLHDSIFWDDWTLAGANSDVIIEKFRMAGLPFSWTGHLHVILSYFPRAIYRILTFTSYFIAGYFLFKTLSNADEKIRGYIFPITLLFLIAPFNSARIAAINLPYALCYLAFFAAWSQMGRRPIISIALFIFSFNTASLLVFYAVPFLEYSIRNNGFRFFTKKEFYIKNWILIILPPAFWVIKNSFFQPYGLYAGYNQGFSASNIPYALGLQISDIISTVYTWRWRELLLTGLLTFISFKLIDRNTLFLESTSKSQNLILMISGVAVLALAEFPYLILAYPPRFFSWDSRHQLLMPLGFSIFTVGLAFLIGSSLRKAFLSIIIGLSLTFWLLQYNSYYIDWTKQKEIMRVISDNDEIRAGRLIVFEDHTGIPNANGRSIVYYEWNGILANLYGDERRFGIDQVQWSNSICKRNDPKFNPHYRSSEVEGNTKGDIVLVKLLRQASTSVIDKVLSSYSPNFYISVEPHQKYCDNLPQ
ncbi:hypothetical protein NTD84_20805 [Pseudomonas sp. 14P_8.1_Bac3]|uniref:hypothetical protein n=1 Tax=Pseudomonas sp. 14P_8.1_Bac3 TaxID=2971621 RepID=UPI0021C8E0D1|nr:hypothetical protein [Pseudomonas sp. 14P_8.1_Bac3]MCU1762148.1 hypothetical protein [Pseudomonas sp. 14P_8.1_Bac3]